MARRVARLLAWRTTPTQTLTDRGFTGHRHNNDLGLIYINARYYVPPIERFASADTIVPDPGQPQSFNRYSYTLNNPIKYKDPSGHCPAPPKDSGNIICVAFFIPTQLALYLEGDDRGFSSDSDPSQSRAWLHINVDDGSIVTQKINPTTTIWGTVTEPLGGNSIDVSFNSDTGEIVLDYTLTHSAVGYQVAPSIDGVIRFKRDESGQIVSSGYRDAFPNAEAYYYENGTVTQTVFQREADTPAFERRLGWTIFGPLNLFGDGKYDQALLYPDEMERIEQNILSNYQSLPLAGGFPQSPSFPSPFTENQGYVPR
jgi:RHS repeat-associated protein